MRNRLLIIAAALAVAGCGGPDIIVTAPPTITPTAAATATPIPTLAWTITACTIAVKDGMPVANGDHDCRGSDGPTRNPAEGQGLYHITDKPVAGAPIAFRVDLKNIGQVASGPLTLAFVGHLNDFFFVDQFTPAACKPVCTMREVGTDKLMATYEYPGPVAAGQSVTLSASFKGLHQGHWSYTVGLLNGTSAQFEDWLVTQDPDRLIAEWDDVQSVVFAR